MKRKRWRYTEIHCLHFKWSFYDHLLISISTRVHKKSGGSYYEILDKICRVLISANFAFVLCNINFGKNFPRDMLGHKMLYYINLIQDIFHKWWPIFYHLNTTQSKSWDTNLTNNYLLTNRKSTSHSKSNRPENLHETISEPPNAHSIMHSMYCLHRRSLTRCTSSYFPITKSSHEIHEGTQLYNII